LVLCRRPDEIGVVPEACIPGAWGASARSLPTFLVPDTAAGEPVAGVVWAWARVAQPRKAASRRGIFMEQEIKLVNAYAVNYES
jgi:hypothetical protein